MKESKICTSPQAKKVLKAQMLQKGKLIQE